MDYYRRHLCTRERRYCRTVVVEVIAFSLVAGLLAQANYTPDAITWANNNVVYVFDTRLAYGEAYCDCAATPKVIHLAAFTLDVYHTQHETQHAWDWAHDYNASQRLADTQLLAQRADRIGDLAKYSLTRVQLRNEVEHVNTYIIEGLNYKIGAVPQWYRAKHAANRKVVYSTFLAEVRQWQRVP